MRQGRDAEREVTVQCMPPFGNRAALIPDSGDQEDAERWPMSEGMDAGTLRG
jgi:hypothetical protein